jgi:electron transfer flavoprotein alpha subunit
VEHAEGALKKVTSELITAARTLGEPSAVVVGKPGTAEPLVDGLKAAGAAKIYVAESDDAENYLITPFVDVLASLAESASPAAVVLASSADGKEIAGRLAARIGAGILSDVVEVREGGKAIHSIFGGAYTVEAEAVGDTPVITVRPGAIEAESSDGAGEVVSVDVPAPAENATKITKREPAVAGDRPELTEATVVVSGGRGVGSAENFDVVEKLADSLKGDERVGATIVLNALSAPMRTIVDNGGRDGSVVADDVSQKGLTIGYDANKGEYVDMLKSGIIDPVKVVRTALANAGSIAGLLLTTEALVTTFDKDDKKKRRAEGAVN